MSPEQRIANHLAEQRNQALNEVVRLACERDALAEALKAKTDELEALKASLAAK